MYTHNQPHTHHTVASTVHMRHVRERRACVEDRTLQMATHQDEAESSNESNEPDRSNCLACAFAAVDVV